MLLFDNFVMKRYLWSEVSPDEAAVHIGTSRLNSGRWTSRHDHDFFECFWCLEGRGAYWLNGEEIELRRGDFWLVRSTDVHAFLARGTDPLVFTNVAVSAAVFERANYLDRSVHALWHGERRHVIGGSEVTSLDTLVQEVAASSRDALDALFFLIGLLRIVRRPLAFSRKSGMPRRLEEALVVGRSPEHLRGGLVRLRQLSGYSAEHLSRVFRKHLKITPTEWLNRERILHARRLLEATSLSVLEISLECGFESASHFHNEFRKRVKQTPRRYRTRLLEVSGLASERSDNLDNG